MAPITLDLVVMSCDDLKAFNCSRKLNTYVTVSIVKDDRRNPKQQTLSRLQKTPTDRKGDRNPVWNHSMQFELGAISDEKVFLRFKVMLSNSFIRDWKIGEAGFPIGDLPFDGNLRCLILSVKNSDGKRRGQLNLSFKLSGDREKAEEDKIVQIKSYSSMKLNPNTVLRLVQTMEWPILPSVSVGDVEGENVSSHDQSRISGIKSVSFDTGFDRFGKNHKKHGIIGSTKWQIELDPRAGRFPGLLI